MNEVKTLKQKTKTNEAKKKAAINSMNCNTLKKLEMAFSIPTYCDSEYANNSSNENFEKSDSNQINKIMKSKSTNPIKDIRVPLTKLSCQSIIASTSQSNQNNNLFNQEKSTSHNQLPESPVSSQKSDISSPHSQSRETLPLIKSSKQPIRKSCRRALFSEDETETTPERVRTNSLNQNTNNMNNINEEDEYSLHQNRNKVNNNTNSSGCMTSQCNNVNNPRYNQYNNVNDIEIGNEDQENNIPENQQPIGGQRYNADNLAHNQDNNANNAANNNVDGNVEAVLGARLLYARTNDFLLSCILYYERAREGHGFEEKRRRYTETEDGKIYLGENICMDKTVWEFLQIESPSYAIKILAMHLWGGSYHLVNRAFDLIHGCDNMPGRSPIKLIENNLLRLLISLFYDFLKRNKSLTMKERAEHMSEAINYVRYTIRNLRSAEKKSF